MVFELGDAASSEVHLLPAGEFRAKDGRPIEVDAWRLDESIARRVMERAEERANPYVIDYEHQTLWAELNGQPAPAAGWFKALDWREDGLWATDVSWTERAAGYIRDGEYRFISAVFSYHPRTGEILEILHAGITNDPALDGLAELPELAAAKLSISSNPGGDPKTMDREQLIQALGLDQGATDEQIQQAVAAAKTAADELGEVRRQLGLGETEVPHEHVVALKAKADSGGEPSPAEYVPRSAFEELRQEVATLKAQQGEQQVEALVEQGRQEGKLTEAMTDWARSLGRQDVAQLRAYLESAAPIAALSGTQTGGQPPAGGGAGGEHGLTESELAVCRAQGIDPQKYAETKRQSQNG